MYEIKISKINTVYSYISKRKQLFILQLIVNYIFLFTLFNFHFNLTSVLIRFLVHDMFKILDHYS